MLPENEARIRQLCGDALAEQVLRVVEEDAQCRRVELAQRQSEGLKRAKAQGTQLGRPPIKRPRKFRAVYLAFQNGELSARAAAQKLGVSPGTFKRWTAEEEK